MDHQGISQQHTEFGHVGTTSRNGRGIDQVVPVTVPVSVPVVVPVCMPVPAHLLMSVPVSAPVSVLV